MLVPTCFFLINYRKGKGKSETKLKREGMPICHVEIIQHTRKGSLGERYLKGKEMVLFLLSEAREREGDKIEWVPRN